MGSRWLLLYVICQTVITESLGGVTLPFTDVIGKVTPIKPKPLSASAVSSAATKSSLTCESKDLLSKLFSQAPGTREFSSPLAFTSSSRALPVPKIDSLSFADVKLPERLRQKFLSSKLCNAPIRNAKPDIGTPDVSLPYKYPFLSSPTKSPNASPSYYSFNQVTSLPNTKSLPVPLEPLKTSNADLSCSPSKSNNVLASPAITTLPGSRTLGAPLTLEEGKPSFLEQFNTNNFAPVDASCSSPYPLYYKSIYLPGVRTPSEMVPLIFRPISYKATGNIDFPSQSDFRNVLSPETLTFDTSLNSLPGRNGPYFSTDLNPIKTSEIPKPINTIQLPKKPSNEPLPIKPVFSAQNVEATNIRPPLAANSGSASVSFESTFEPPEFLSSSVLKDCTDSEMLRSSMPYLLADKIPDFRLKPCAPLKIRPSPLGSTSNFLNFPVMPLAPISPSSPIFDVTSNRLSSYDCTKNINTPDMFPNLGACVDTIEKVNTNGPGNNCQNGDDSKYVPSLERINLLSPFAPKLASYQHPLFTEECGTNPLKYSPPIIPAISSGSAAFSPLTYFPSKITQNPSSVSSINQSPSIAQSTSKIVSSINDVVTNIAQNTLSSYKSYIDSAPPNVSQRPTYIIQSNPYDTTEFIPKQILPVLPLTQENLVITEPILPIICSPICINPPAIETSTIVSTDGSCKSTTFEISSNQPLLIASPQPTVTVLPQTSLITFPSSQLCPSYLPSPSLPAYPVIAPPFYIEAPVFKVSPSKKDSDIEKLIELMLLAEILNNDESFDWDDLDTLLAFLSVS